MNSAAVQRVVLVTGSSAGLGLHIARAFGKQSATQVVICGRDETKLFQAAEQLANEGLQVAAVQADVTVQEDVDRLFTGIKAQFGRLDVLVNNAGRSTRGQAIETSPTEFQALWEINFLSAVRCTQAAFPLLKESRGSVVLIGSLASKLASRYLGAYPATKFPLAAYAQQLRLELQEIGVHTLLVCPGPIRREDAGERYAEQAADLPAAASKPGGGVKIKGLEAAEVANRIVRACELRQAELILPAKTRLLLAISALFPTWGDWLIQRYTRQ